MKQAKSGYMAKHLANGLKYIMDPDKTEGGRYVSGSNCIPENALAQMLETKRHFGKLDKRQGYHFIISFEEENNMDENCKAELQKFFSVSAVIFLVVYLVFLMLSFFSNSFSIPLFAGLMFVEFFLLLFCSRSATLS